MSSLLPDLARPEEPEYHREAFLHPVNLTFLVGVGIAAFLLAGTGGWQTLVLLFGGALELLYLGLAPQSERFRRLIRSRRTEEDEEAISRHERVRQLSRRNQKRFLRLQRLKEAIRANYRKVNDAARGLLESHLRKLDDLLSAHLEMLYLQERYRAFTSETAREELTAEMSELEDRMADTSAEVRAIRKRQLSILEKRLERYDAAEDRLEILDAQIDTIEEVARYVHEESLTLTNPQEITLQLDTLVSEVEETRETVRELDDLLSGRPGDLLQEIDESAERPPDEPAQEASSEEAPSSPNRRP